MELQMKGSGGAVQRSLQQELKACGHLGWAQKKSAHMAKSSMVDFLPQPFQNSAQVDYLAFKYNFSFFLTLQIEIA